MIDETENIGLTVIKKVENMLLDYLYHTEQVDGNLVVIHLV